jgi:FemAB-related protein (PEP-CTERM system-associated)
MGGILADNKNAFQKLTEYALEKLRSLNAQSLELRQIRSSDFINEKKPDENLKNGFYTSDVAENKAVMRLNLPENSEELFNSYKSKFRNDIKKPFRNALEFKIGGRELLNDFYHIFSVNMRDLGSPVHSLRLFENIFSSFQDKAHIGAVYKDNKPVAAIFTIGFRDILANPWASSLREYKSLNVNIFQYWKMLEYGCDYKYKIFDFGRSAPEDSTFKFKKKWGAVPYPLFWENFSIKYKENISEKSKFSKFIKYWQKTPVFITKTVGPPIRKNIGL